MLTKVFSKFGKHVKPVNCVFGSFSSHLRAFLKGQWETFLGTPKLCAWGADVSWGEWPKPPGCRVAPIVDVIPHSRRRRSRAKYVVECNLVCEKTRFRQENASCFYPFCTFFQFVHVFKTHHKCFHFLQKPYRKLKRWLFPEFNMYAQIINLGGYELRLFTGVFARTCLDLNQNSQLFYNCWGGPLITTAVIKLPRCLGLSGQAYNFSGLLLLNCSMFW